MCENSPSQHEVIYSPDHWKIWFNNSAHLSYWASPSFCPAFSKTHWQSPDWVRNISIFYHFYAYHQISGSGSLYPTKQKGGSHPVQFSLVKVYLNPQKDKAEPPVCVSPPDQPPTLHPSPERFKGFSQWLSNCHQIQPAKWINVGCPNPQRTATAGGRLVAGTKLMQHIE